MVGTLTEELELRIKELEEKLVRYENANSRLFGPNDALDYQDSCPDNSTENNGKIAFSIQKDANFQDLLNMNVDPVVIVRNNFECRMVNAKFLELFGYIQQDIENGLSVFDLIRDRDRKTVQKQLKDRFSGKNVASGSDPIDLVSKDGRIISCEISALPIHNNGCLADLVFIRDVTKRKQAEQELRKHRNHLEELLIERAVESGERSKALHREITERRRAEKALTSRLRYEKGLARCSQSILNDDLTAAISHLLEASEVSRVYIFENFRDKNDGLCMRQTNEACAPGVKVEIDNPQLQHLPYKDGFKRWLTILSEGGVIGGLVEDFPQGEKDILVPQEIISMLVLPIKAEGQWHGFIGFDDTKTKRDWSEDDIRILKTGSQMIGAYLSHKRSERALWESEEKFRSLVELSSDWIWKTDQDGIFTYADPKIKRFLGYEPEEVIGKSFNHFMPEEEAERVAFFFKRNGKKRAHFFRFKNTQIHKDGHHLVIETSGMPIFDNDGNVVGWKGVDTDINELVQTEEALRESEIRHRDLVENVNDMIWEIDAEGRFTYASPQSLSVLGYEPEELIGRSPFEMMPPKEERRIRDMFRDLLSNPGPRSYFEVIKIHKDGSLIHLESSGKPFYDTNGNLLGFRGVERNISERKQAEEKLRTEHDKFRGVLNVIGEGLYIVNQDYVIEYQNKILERYFTSSTGKKCYSTYFASDRPCDFCPMNETIFSGEIRQIEADLPDGKIYEIISSPFTDVDGNVKSIVLLRDITEKKTLQAEAVRAGHLAALGELAAGVAHEVNNPINGVINYAEMLKDECDDKKEDPDIPNRIIKEGERIAKIVRKLLFFARDNNEDASPFRMADILSDVLNLVEKRIIKDGITLSLEIPETLPSVKVRDQEIQQVFLNIISNGRHALNRKFPKIHENKILEIRGEAVEIDGRAHVRTMFCDRGTGIPVGIMNKICNPFFTTKPKDEGTGLGLSISHGIIKNHGGKLQFESVEGEYTRVVVDLPVDNHKN